MKIKNKFQDIINLVSNVMEAYTTALFIADEKKEFMELYCYQSFCKKIDEKCIIKNGEGLIGWVIREKKNVLAKNFERNTKTLGFYKEDEKIKSLMAIALPEGLGVLFVDSKKSYIFTEEKEKILTQFAQLLYSCIRDQEKLNINYLQEIYLQFLVTFEKIIERTDFFEKVSSLLFENIKCSHFIFVVPHRCVYTYTFDDYKKTNVFKRHSLDYYSAEGLMGWCIKNRKNLVKNNLNSKKSIILNEDENKDRDNFVGISLYEKKKSVVGAVGFVKKEKHEKFLSKKTYWNKEEVSFLEIIGNKILKIFVEKEIKSG